MRRLCILISVLLFSCSVWTQERSFVSDVLFSQGRGTIEVAFQNNRESLDSLNTLLNAIKNDTTLLLSSIEIQTFASPEGSIRANALLSQKRCNAMERYIRAIVDIPDSLLKKNIKGVAWDRLRGMVAASDMPYRNMVLNCIDNYPELTWKDGVVVNGRNKRLMDLKGGVPYNYMTEHFFPALRGVIVITILHKTVATPVVEKIEQIKEKPAIKPQENTLSDEPVDEPQPRKPLLAVKTDSPAAATLNQTDNLPEQRGPIHCAEPIIGLKTDLILWSGVMPGFKMGTWTPNLSAEVYFARRWSVELSGAYANWGALSGEKKLYAVMSINLEGRYWFRKTSTYKGFYLGLYAQNGEYDVQQTQINQTGSFYGGGLGVGYLLPLSKHWGVEAQIRGGYRSASNDLYDIEDGHYYLNRNENVGKFVPQLKLQVVYRFGKPANKRISYE